MSAERAIALVRPLEAPLAAEPVSAGPVAIPPYVVARIAEAAVAAYIEAKRREDRAYQAAYRRVNGERLRAQARARYARGRRHDA